MSMDILFPAYREIIPDFERFQDRRHIPQQQAVTGRTVRQDVPEFRQFDQFFAIARALFSGLVIVHELGHLAPHAGKAGRREWSGCVRRVFAHFGFQIGNELRSCFLREPGDFIVAIDHRAPLLQRIQKFGVLTEYPNLLQNVQRGLGEQG